MGSPDRQACRALTPCGDRLGLGLALAVLLMTLPPLLLAAGAVATALHSPAGDTALTALGRSLDSGMAVWLPAGHPWRPPAAYSDVMDWRFDPRLAPLRADMAELLLRPAFRAWP